MTLDKPTKKRLEAAGWKVGGTSEFLGLTEEETAIVELKLALPVRLESRGADEA